MRADVRDDYLPVLASGPPIEVPVEVLFVGEVRFLEVDPPSFDNGLTGARITTSVAFRLT